MVGSNLLGYLSLLRFPALDICLEDNSWLPEKHHHFERARRVPVLTVTIKLLLVADQTVFLMSANGGRWPIPWNAL